MECSSAIDYGRLVGVFVLAVHSGKVGEPSSWRFVSPVRVLAQEGEGWNGSESQIDHGTSAHARVDHADDCLWDAIK
jgi:hypothetical protein